MFAEINSKCYAAVINFFAFEFLSEFRFPTPTETNIVAPNKKLAFFTTDSISCSHLCSCIPDAAVRSTCIIFLFGTILTMIIPKSLRVIPVAASCPLEDLQR